MAVYVELLKQCATNRMLRTSFNAKVIFVRKEENNRKAQSDFRMLEKLFHEISRIYIRLQEQLV